MSEKVRKMKLPHKQDEAAQLLAEDRLTDREIAQQLNITERQLYRWKKLPTVADRIEEIRTATAAQILAQGIRRKETRLAKLDGLIEGLDRVIAERSFDMVGVPGGQSGLLVRTIKKIGSGEDAEKVEEYAVDTKTIKEYREVMRHAAVEKGEWTEKFEHAGTDGQPLFNEIADVLNKIYGSDGENSG
jgi:hypothetical protein